MKHVLQQNERRGSPSNGRGIPGRNKKECGSHHENSTTGTNVQWEKQRKMSIALTVSSFFVTGL
jgi:hypothetical protein